MRCYYDVLCVSHDVDQAELRKAYYKLSLQYHPDKNLNSPDSTANFQLIQEAYRVLSDPQERAWYDNHRAQILQSNGRVGATSDYQEERVDVFQYFTRSCFEHFDDEAKGFYTVYRKVFADIADEEKRSATFCRQTATSHDDLNRNDGSAYPSFGWSNSSYADVVGPFYSFWEAFETCKTYTWVEKYDTRFAVSRQERRNMESENRRLRNAAIRERNEEIHQLVAFVKKRDKRLIAERDRIKGITLENQMRTMNMATVARQREAELLEQEWDEQLNSGGIAAQWSKEFEDELARIEAALEGVHLNSKAKGSAGNCTPGTDVNDDGDEEDQTSYAFDYDINDVDALYCIACDKYFASVNAKQNHESSKKHRKQVDMLCQIMRSEDLEIKKSLNANDVELVEKLLDSQVTHSPPEKPEFKLTKRAKKAEKKRRKEANIGNEHVTEDLTGPDILTEPSECIVESSRVEFPVINTVEHSETVVCRTCLESFPSRNALFSHLRSSGHAKLQISPPTICQNKSKSTTRRKNK